MLNTQKRLQIIALVLINLTLLFKIVCPQLTGRCTKKAAGPLQMES